MLTASLATVAASSLLPPTHHQPNSARTLGRELAKLARGRRWREALRLLNAQQLQDIIDDKHINQGVSLCAKTGQWREALGLLAQLRHEAADSGDRASPAARAYTVAINALGRAGEWRAAVDVLARMRASGQTPPDTVAYNAAMAAASRAGRADEVARLLGEMKKTNIRLDEKSYTTAIDALGRAGRSDTALRLFRHMPAAGVEYDEISFNAAISACAAGGAWREGVALLRQMGEAGVAPTAVSYCAAMTACSNAQQWHVALELFEAMRTREGREEEREEEEKEEAGRRGEDARGEEEEEEVVAVEEEEGKKGRRQEGRRQEGRGAPRFVVDAAAYSAAITASSRAGEFDAALRLFAELGPRRADVVSYNAALHACALGGRWRSALELYAAMGAARVLPDDVTYSLLLQCLWDREEATALLEEAMERAAFGHCLREARDGSLLLDMHSFSPGAAVAMTLWLLSRLVKTVLDGGPPPPPRVRVVTGRGKHAPAWRAAQTETVRTAVGATLRACAVPLLAGAEGEGARGGGGGDAGGGGDGHVDLDMARLPQWVESAVASGLVKGCFARRDLWVLDLPQAQKDQVVAAARAAGAETRRTQTHTTARSPHP